MNMNTVASNTPPAKLTKKKNNLNNKLKVKPKDVNNVKNNRNRKVIGNYEFSKKAKFWVDCNATFI